MTKRIQLSISKTKKLIISRDVIFDEDAIYNRSKEETYFQVYGKKKKNEMNYREQNQILEKIKIHQQKQVISMKNHPTGHQDKEIYLLTYKIMCLILIVQLQMMNQLTFASLQILNRLVLNRPLKMKNGWMP